MNIGDLVRLKQPFKPAAQVQSFSFGLIIGMIEAAANWEVLVHLYDPKTDGIYIDELGARPVYYFRLDEVVSELVEN